VPVNAVTGWTTTLPASSPNSSVCKTAWFWIWPPPAVTVTAKVNVRTLPGARADISPTHPPAETVHESPAEAEADPAT
jgi:hypothetical protein